MAAIRDMPFPLVIICLLLIRGYSLLPTTPQGTSTSPERPLSPRGFSSEDPAFPKDDYDQLEDTVTPITPDKVSPYGGVLQRCKYDPCLENQVPCAVLASSTRCMCPGFTLRNVVPEDPSLTSVSWNGSQVTIKWCAPYSYVTDYVVTVGGQEQRKFGKDQRSGAVGVIDHIAEVCVVAVNERGASNGSCLMYHPSDNSLALKAGLIGGALALLLLLLLAFLLLRHRRQRKQEASISMHDAAETQ